MRSRHLSVVIEASPAQVYAFAREPGNLRRWAAGLAQAEVQATGDQLVVDSPMGQVLVTFVQVNDYGVLDHDVQLPSGMVVSNPLRVLDHPTGAEVVFTLRQLDLSDEEFDADAAMVDADLVRLKALVEGNQA